jgi:hypothetical protein
MTENQYHFLRLWSTLGDALEHSFITADRVFLGFFTESFLNSVK